MRRKLRHDRGVPYSRRLVAALGAVLVVAACTSSSPGHAPSSGPAPASDKPSIVLVLGDELTPDLLRFMPHVVDLQRSGTSFGNYFVTGTDRTPIFTGRYPHNAAPTDASFAAALQRVGYRTAIMGEDVPGYGPGGPPAPGWDEWDVTSGSASGFGFDLDENGTVQHFGRGPGNYVTDVLAAKAGEFISSATQAGAPFLLVVAPTAPGPAVAPPPRDAGTFPQLGAPHGPAFGRLPSDPPTWSAGLPPLSGTDLLTLDRDYERRVEAVQSLDRLVRHVGHVLQGGPAADNTYVVVSSSGGYHDGEHRLLPGSGTAFDTDIRVPLVVRGPAVVANATVDAMASSIDLAPTFEAIAGATPSSAPDGSSLVPLLHGTVPTDWQQAVLVEQRVPPAQPRRAGAPPGFTAVRTADTAYVNYTRDGAEYYNIADDPDEVHNMSGSASAGELADQRATLTALANCTGAAQCQAAAAP
jgi:arylsulfatase A-like enzyme